MGRVHGYIQACKPVSTAYVLSAGIPGSGLDC